MIEIHKVSKIYRSLAGSLRALDDCSLNIARGEICGIIGRSGAGKSTLLRLINRLEKPDSGSVAIAGQDLAALDERSLRQMRRRIGMIFQHFNLLQAADVFSNIALPLHNSGWERKQIRERVETLLERVGLGGKAHYYPRQLSGGQKQRVAIARALSSAPEILLCDEATSALDPNTTRDILRLILGISKEYGLTVVFVCHQMEVVQMVCDRVVVMENARIVEQGSLISVFTEPQTQTTRELIAKDSSHVLPQSFKALGRTLYRLGFIGASAEMPLIAEVARRFAVRPNIIGGGIQQLAGTPYGSLTLDLEGDMLQVHSALDYLHQHGVVVEVIETC